MRFRHNWFHSFDQDKIRDFARQGTFPGMRGPHVVKGWDPDDPNGFVPSTVDIAEYGDWAARTYNAPIFRERAAYYQSILVCMDLFEDEKAELFCGEGRQEPEQLAKREELKKRMSVIGLGAENPQAEDLTNEWAKYVYFQCQSGSHKKMMKAAAEGAEFLEGNKAASGRVQPKGRVDSHSASSSSTQAPMRADFRPAAPSQMTDQSADQTVRRRWIPKADGTYIPVPDYVPPKPKVVAKKAVHLQADGTYIPPRRSDNYVPPKNKAVAEKAPASKPQAVWVPKRPAGAPAPDAPVQRPRMAPPPGDVRQCAFTDYRLRQQADAGAPRPIVKGEGKGRDLPPGQWRARQEKGTGKGKDPAPGYWTVPGDWGPVGPNPWAGHWGRRPY